MNTVIDVQHLKKTFNKETALQDVSFTIQKGKYLAFLVQVVLVKQLLLKY